MEDEVVHCRRQKCDQGFSTCGVCDPVEVLPDQGLCQREREKKNPCSSCFFKRREMKLGTPGVPPWSEIVPSLRSPDGFPGSPLMTHGVTYVPSRLSWERYRFATLSCN